MNEKEIHEKRKEILRKLALDENDILENLDNLVEKSKQFIRFNTKTGEIIFYSDYDLIYEEKIFLFLLGKYYVYQFGITEEQSYSRNEIKEEAQIPESTGISNQINKLLKEKIIKKKEKDKYEINPFKIEIKLTELQAKYINKEQNQGEN